MFRIELKKSSEVAKGAVHPLTFPQPKTEGVQRRKKAAMRINGKNR
jgi:hypothetical protein